MDLARLDIADWMADQAVHATGVTVPAAHSDSAPTPCTQVTAFAETIAMRPLRGTGPGDRGVRAADPLVDGASAAFLAAMSGHVPALKLITSEEAVRALRVLAVFTCPAPTRHKEVRVHALNPLGEDAREILTPEAKQRLEKLFKDGRARRLSLRRGRGRCRGSSRSCAGTRRARRGR